MTTIMRRRRRKMNILDADFSLLDIEHRLEEIFKANEKTLRTIGDLDITYEDYKYLILKLKGLTKYITRIEVLEQYKLSIVTALVFAVRYEHDLEGVYHSMLDLIGHFQQHHVRYIMRICLNVFYELGLSTYGIHCCSLDDVFEVISIHANLSRETQDTVFQILDDYFNMGEAYLLEEELVEKLNEVIRNESPYLKDNVETLTMTYLLKDLYAACYVKHNSLKQLLSEYNQLSIQLVEACYMWYIKYSRNSNRLIKIR